MPPSSIIEIHNLSVIFKRKKSVFYAVKNVSFYINKGQSVALVGESGCGKSTIAKSIVGIQPITNGEVIYEGNVICNNQYTSPKDVKKDIQMIFQDPYSSLNPRMTIKQIIKEPLNIYKIGSPKDQDKKVNRMLDLCCLPRHYKYRYPHELSGGERQRVSIARALICDPKVLICDEPTHALDVSVQASIINLLDDLKKELNLAMLFISHDLGIVRLLTDVCLVMYNGEIVERGCSKQILKKPRHPFTKRLLQAVPSFNNEHFERPDIAEESKLELQPCLDNSCLSTLVGKLQKSVYKQDLADQHTHLCPYLEKCPVKKPCCLNENPSLHEEEDSLVRCHLYDKKHENDFSQLL